MSTETRRFGMHANLLYDVITKQAGTLQKAILEGVMNGVDADATRISITLNPERVVIEDDGKGFADRSEIKNFFETFGTPHEEGDATYGRFRMGRGQMFAFGKNSWSTNTFRMDVDIKGRGLDYDLREVSEQHPGCRIEIDLYDPLIPSEIDDIRRSMKEWVAYVDVPVELDGVVISNDPANEDWTIETDDAYYNISPTKTNLAVYNLGVLVMKVHAGRYGVGGKVVSKERLDVNFARNDVTSSCPVFSRIKAELKKHSNQETKKTRKLTDAQRHYICEQISSATITLEDLKKPVLTEIEGRQVSLESLTNGLWKNNGNLLVAKKGDRFAIRVKQQGIALCLATETMEALGCGSTQEVIDVLIKAVDNIPMTDDLSHGWRIRSLKSSLQDAKAVELDDYRHLVTKEYEPLEPAKLPKSRKVLLDAVHKASFYVAHEMGVTGRHIMPGQSDLAHAWTDGTSTIWIETRQLAQLGRGYRGCARIAALLAHEYLHSGPDTETHEHDQEFHERFHDSVIDTDLIGRAADAMMASLAVAARKDMKSPSKAVLKFEDLNTLLERAGGKPNGKLISVQETDDEEDLDNVEDVDVEDDACEEEQAKAA